MGCEPVSPAAADVEAPARVEEWRSHQYDGLFTANSAYRRHCVRCHPDNMPEVQDSGFQFQCRRLYNGAGRDSC